VRLDDFGPNVQSVADILQEAKDDIRPQKGFGQNDSSNGGIVEGAFEPLVGVRLAGAIGEAHDVSRERTNPLRAHGIALVGHGAGSNLGLGKGLLDLFQVGEQANVAAHFVGRLRNTGQDAENKEFNLARVSLSRYGNGFSKAHEFADALIELFDLVVVSIKEFEKGGLCSGGALDAAHGKSINFAIDSFEIQEEILDP